MAPQTSAAPTTSGDLTCRGQKEAEYGLFTHDGGVAQCNVYAGKLNTLVAGCGFKLVRRGKPDRGFVCAAGATKTAGEAFIGTKGSAKDCKGLVRMITKALKRVSKHPLHKFACEAFGDDFQRIKATNPRKCEAAAEATNSVINMVENGQFAKCNVITTRAPPPQNLGPYKRDKTKRVWVTLISPTFNVN